MSKEQVREFLCIEHGELFTIDAKDLEDARQIAAMYGAEVIKEQNKQ
jgi:hypothetical protein